MPERKDLTQELTGRARGAAYAVVGLGVLGLQKAQLQRAELQRRLVGEVGLEERLAAVRAALSGGVQHLDAVVGDAVDLVESTLEPWEAQLPPTARELAAKAHAQVRQVHHQLRDLVSHTA